MSAAGGPLRANTVPYLLAQQAAQQRAGAESPRTPVKLAGQLEAQPKDLHLDGSEPRIFPGAVSSSTRTRSQKGKQRSWSEKDGGGSQGGSESGKAQPVPQ